MAPPVEDLSRNTVQPGTEGVHLRTQFDSQRITDTISNPEDTQAAFPGHLSEYAKQKIRERPESRGDWVLFHPVYTPSELKAVQVLRHQPENMGDRVAAFLVRALR